LDALVINGTFLNPSSIIIKINDEIILRKRVS
jgi:hypothetical protein